MNYEQITEGCELCGMEFYPEDDSGICPNCTIDGAQDLDGELGRTARTEAGK